MSAASAKTQEPSMEEILASIRRIIAEDQDSPKDAAPEHGPEADREAEDDVLELDAAAPAAPEPDPAPAELPDIEVAIPEIVFADAPEEMRSEAAPQVDAPAALPEPLVAPAAARQAAPAPQSALAETLLSNAAGDSVGQAFNMLSHTVLDRNARTLEDLVKEMLKPMLKMWLDDNLPPLVERLVRAEIERVARGRT